jgi:hypothetical protein
MQPNVYIRRSRIELNISWRGGGRGIIQGLPVYRRVKLDLKAALPESTQHKFCKDIK